MRKPIGRLIALCILTAGCTTDFVVKDVTDVKAGCEVSGIPFRLPQSYSAYVFHKKPGGKYELEFVERTTLGQRDRVYSINFDANYFSKSTLQVKLNENGTLGFAKLTGDPKIDEFVTALGAQIGDVADAFEKAEEDRRKKEEDRKKEKKERREEAEGAAEAARQKRITKLELDEAAMEALLAVEAAERDLHLLPDDAEVGAREALIDELRRKQVAANLAYFKAGRPAPFPRVFS